MALSHATICWPSRFPVNVLAIFLGMFAGGALLAVRLKPQAVVPPPPRPRAQLITISLYGLDIDGNSITAYDQKGTILGDPSAPYKLTRSLTDPPQRYKIVFTPTDKRYASQTEDAVWYDKARYEQWLKQYEHEIVGTDAKRRALWEPKFHDFVKRATENGYDYPVIFKKK